MIASNTSQPIVVLVPGLWVPAWGMRPLAWRLQRDGYRCVCFGYASARAGLADNAERLARFVASLGADSVCLVGHSLGGVLAMYATHQHSLSQVRRIVLAGSPYVDSYAARVLARARVGRWMLGRTVPEWLACDKPSAPAHVDVGVIAGTRALGLGMLVARDIPKPHDGVVCVNETPVPGMRDAINVDISHSSMLVSVLVARLISAFLRHGEFDAARAPHERKTARYGAAAGRESR